MDNNLGAVAIRTSLILPFVCPQLTFHINTAAFMQVLVANLSKPCPGNDTVPFGMFLRLAIRAFLALCTGQAKRYNRSA